MHLWRISHSGRKRGSGSMKKLSRYAAILQKCSVKKKLEPPTGFLVELFIPAHVKYYSYSNITSRKSCLGRLGTYLIRSHHWSGILGSILLMQMLFLLNTAWLTEWQKTPIPRDMSVLRRHALLSKILAMGNQCATTVEWSSSIKLRYSGM